jgi:hypothetical protein
METPADPEGTSMPRSYGTWIAMLLLIAAAAGASLYLWTRWEPPRLTERHVQEVVYTTIQREAQQSFYVTGSIDVMAVASVEDTRVLLPRMLDLRVGTTRASVRVPGRVSYGFDVRGLPPEMIRVEENVIQLTLPELAIYSAEPNLAEMEVQTDVGWTRLPSSGPEAERRALRHVNEALQQQGQAHLRNSVQPRVNSARALGIMLMPVLQAAGVPDPVLRFHVGDGLIVEHPS